MKETARLFLSALLLVSFILLISSPVSTFFQIHESSGPSFSDLSAPEIQQIVGYAILYSVILCVIWLIPENRENPNQVTEDRKP